MQVSETRPPRRGRWLAGSLIALVLASIALVIFLQYRPRQVSTSDEALLVLEPTRIAEGIYLLGELSPSVAYVVQTSAGLVLIDSGSAADAGPLKEEMGELGLDWKKTRAILLTHAHVDHTAGAEHLRSATGSKVYAGREDARVLRAGGPRAALFGIFDSSGAPAHATTIDVELDGDRVIEIGDTRFRALNTPGHTPGSICYLMERNGLRVLFSGDVIISLLGRTDISSKLLKPLGTYTTYLPPRYRGDARQYLRTLQKLRALRAPDLVLPGHPSFDPTPQNPRMSPERWTKLLDDGISEMNALLARYKKDGAGFLDGNPKKLLPDLYYLGDSKGTAIYGLLAASKLFIVNVPSGPSPLDFVSARLEKVGLKPPLPTAVLLTSCGPQETAGLRDLVEKSHALVVAPPEGLALVKEACPPGTTVLSAEDLPGKGWLPVKPVPLRGRGRAPCGYEVKLGGKTVLFTGPVPIGISFSTMRLLATDFAELRGDRAEYRASLKRLGELKPDLWLLAAPADGQNANLYDDDWNEILAQNEYVTNASARGAPQ